MANTDTSRDGNTVGSPAISAIANRFDQARTRPKLGFNDDNSRQYAALNYDDPSGPQFDVPLNSSIPQWQRDLAASRAGRHSRASSVMSTRTRLTVQSDDARSVEFEAGGHSFRISRDGSRVTDVTAPPPYPGPPLDRLIEESDEEVLSERSLPNEDEHEAIQQQTPKAEEVTAEDNAMSYSIPLRTHVPPGAIQNDALPENNQKATTSQVLELPRKLKNMFGLNWPISAASTSSLPENSTTAQLRRTQSDTSSIPPFQDTFEQSYLKHTRGHRPCNSLPDLPIDSGEVALQDADIVDLLEEGDKKIAEVTRCYNRVMRDLDHEHRKKLHERDIEIARLHELLNEKDIVYRQQLRDRDNTIETLSEQLNYKNITINEVKTQIYNLEEDVERRLEQARNLTEDVWEKRWKEYENLLLGRLEKRSGSTTMSLSQDHEANVNDAGRHN
ncbi:hypothetical protein H2198_004063 [Neophaeococcomyces mojaviensis]|uniref:Uncharacterized protein n=1 Tax=Neophaeococcomyces mojaviensis TaxID=3383035 RepID=A0ACC3A9P6_9EURO|nr:hypothetical protein H2198_004063 [Knufia sp. JES_112]